MDPVEQTLLNKPYSSTQPFKQSHILRKSKQSKKLIENN